MYNNLMIFHRFGFLILLFLALAAPLWATESPVSTQPNDEGLLAKEVWREQAYGLGLHPPLGAKLQHETIDDAILRMYCAPGFTIRVYIKKSQGDLTIDQVLESSQGQLAIAQPSAIILDQKKTQAAGRPGAIIYYHIPEPKKAPWVMGQAFLQIDPRTIAVLWLEVNEKLFVQIRPVYEAVYHSLSLENPAEINKQRQALIERGDAWHRTIDAQNLHAAIVPEQWFRIVENGQDTGYMRVSQSTGQEMNQPGLKMEIQSRVTFDAVAYDTLSNYFLSDDLDQEIWSIRMTNRPLHPSTPDPKQPSPNNTWVETGVRTGMRVTVTRQSPTGVKEIHWVRPDKGYLSQIEMWLTGPLLPHAQPGEYGFYAYYPNTGKLTFRTEQVEPQADGTYRLVTHPTPDQSAQISHYDARGRLLERDLGTGRMMIPTTKAELTALWKLK